MIRVGDKVRTWYSDSPDGMSEVLAVLPYEGRYPENFTHVLRLTAPKTRAGWMEQAWKI